MESSTFLHATQGLAVGALYFLSAQKMDLLEEATGTVSNYFGKNIIWISGSAVFTCLFHRAVMKGDFYSLMPMFIFKIGSIGVFDFTVHHNNILWAARKAFEMLGNQWKSTAQPLL